MTKNLIILLLLGLLIWFGAAIIKLENHRYISQLNMCPWTGDAPEDMIERDRCFEETETRTNRLAHLAYGLGLL